MAARSRSTSDSRRPPHKRVNDSSDLANAKESAGSPVIQQFVERTELSGIRTTKVHAELVAEEVDDVTRVDSLKIEVRAGARILDSDRFRCTYTFDVEVANTSAEHLANLTVEFVASFRMLDQSGIDREQLTSFTKQVGYIVVFPYAREAIQALSVRLGLDPITLGLLQQDQDIPRSVSFTSGSRLSLRAT